MVLKIRKNKKSYTIADIYRDYIKKKDVYKYKIHNTNDILKEVSIVTGKQIGRAHV